MAQGKKVGLVTVRLYRPFSAEALVNAIPDSVKQISRIRQNKRARFSWRASVLRRCSSSEGNKIQ